MNNFPTLGLTTAWYLPKSSRIKIFLKCLELFFHALGPDCFEFRACLAFRCLCSQNIKKNIQISPPKGIKEWLKILGSSGYFNGIVVQQYPFMLVKLESNHAQFHMVLSFNLKTYIFLCLVANNISEAFESDITKSIY